MFDEQGNNTWAMEIDIYGQVKNVKGRRENCPFRYPGQYEDCETGLYYNRFRYYDPEVGGYVSQDPIRTLGGLRLLGYPGNPTHDIDPFGLTSCAADDPRVKDAITSGRPIIVVGRSQTTRVEVVAAQISGAGGKVHLHNPKVFRSSLGNLDRVDLENNRVWLRYWAKKKGALVVDIGHDPVRGPRDLGVFYGMEKKSLYQNWADDGIDIVPFDPGF